MSNLIAGNVNLLLKAAEKVKQCKWLFIVCPAQSELRRELLLILPAVFPELNPSDRTLLFPDGNRISLASVADPCPIPEGDTFYITLQGWAEDTGSDPKDLARWRERATGMVSL